MSIGLKISRPVAAIADPSRLIIQDVLPTFMSVESFLQSAQFSITEDQDAHGGFDPKEKGGQLATGIGREGITGILPLFLFKEHWDIARRKVQPVFGFMCTLDVMGYSSEMLFTIPFLVLQKAQEKVQNQPAEINFKILHLVEQTCMNLIEQSHTFRNDMI